MERLKDTTVLSNSIVFIMQFPTPLPILLICESGEKRSWHINQSMVRPSKCFS